MLFIIICVNVRVQKHRGLSLLVRWGQATFLRATCLQRACTPAHHSYNRKVIAGDSDTAVLLGLACFAELLCSGSGRPAFIATKRHQTRQERLTVSRHSIMAVKAVCRQAERWGLWKSNWTAQRPGDILRGTYSESALDKRQNLSTAPPATNGIKYRGRAFFRFQTAGE